MNSSANRRDVCTGTNIDNMSHTFHVFMIEAVYLTVKNYSMEGCCKCQVFLGRHCAATFQAIILCSYVCTTTTVTKDLSASARLVQNQPASYQILQKRQTTDCSNTGFKLHRSSATILATDTPSSLQ